MESLRKVLWFFFAIDIDRVAVAICVDAQFKVTRQYLLLLLDFPAGSDFADDLSVVSSPTEAPESQDIGVDPPEDLDNQVMKKNERKEERDQWTTRIGSALPLHQHVKRKREMSIGLGIRLNKPSIWSRISVNQVIIEDEIWQYRYPPFFDPPSAQSLTAVGTTEEDEDEFASEEDPVVQVSTAAPVPVMAWLLLF